MDMHPLHVTSWSIVHLSTWTMPGCRFVTRYAMIPSDCHTSHDMATWMAWSQKEDYFPLQTGGAIHMTMFSVCALGSECSISMITNPSIGAKIIESGWHDILG